MGATDDKGMETPVFAKIILNIDTTLKDDTGEDQEINLITEGQIGERNGNSYITYDETEISGMQGSKTTIKLEPHRLTLIRNGKIATKMEFSVGEMFMTAYETPFGLFDMIIKTKNLRYEKEEMAGNIWLEYSIEMGSNKLQNCSMKIKYRIQE